MLYARSTVPTYVADRRDGNGHNADVPDVLAVGNRVIGTRNKLMVVPIEHRRIHLCSCPLYCTSYGLLIWMPV